MEIKEKRMMKVLTSIEFPLTPEISRPFF